MEDAGGPSATTMSGERFPTMPHLDLSDEDLERLHRRILAPPEELLHDLVQHDHCISTYSKWRRSCRSRRTSWAASATPTPTSPPAQRGLQRERRPVGHRSPGTPLWPRRRLRRHRLITQARRRRTASAPYVPLGNRQRSAGVSQQHSSSTGVSTTAQPQQSG